MYRPVMQTKQRKTDLRWRRREQWRRRAVNRGTSRCEWTTTARKWRRSDDREDSDKTEDSRRTSPRRLHRATADIHQRSTASGADYRLSVQAKYDRYRLAAGGWTSSVRFDVGRQRRWRGRSDSLTLKYDDHQLQQLAPSPNTVDRICYSASCMYGVDSRTASDIQFTSYDPLIVPRSATALLPSSARPLKPKFHLARHDTERYLVHVGLYRNSRIVSNLTKDTSNVSKRVARDALTRWRHWRH